MSADDSQVQKCDSQRGLPPKAEAEDQQSQKRTGKHCPETQDVRFTVKQKQDILEEEKRQRRFERVGDFLQYE